MRRWICKCGKSEAFGSDSPAPCMSCEHCGSSLLRGVDGEQLPVAPHEFYQQQVETDNGPQPLSRCRYCRRKKAELGPAVLADRSGDYDHIRIPLNWRLNGEYHYVALVVGGGEAVLWVDGNELACINVEPGRRVDMLFAQDGSLEVRGVTE